MTMTVDIRPDRTIGIQIASAPGIGQPAPLTLRENERFLIHPRCHRGTGVPAMAVICRRKGFRIPFTVLAFRIIHRLLRPFS